MAKIFLSHSSKDKGFVRKLATSLNKLGHIVWLDEWEIRVGDSIVSKIESGIEQADFVVVILSKKSTSSEWVQKEWQAKYWDEINRRNVFVLPILLEECPIPILLRTKKYADFSLDYEAGLIELALSLQRRPDFSGITRFYPDFVDINNDWMDFFNHSIHLDILAMYSATWRNTYLKYFKLILSKPEGRLRIVFPDLSKSPVLLRIYSERLEIEPKELHQRFNRAIKDFSKLSEIGKVEIYTTLKYLNHACYLFNTGGVIALYSYQAGRVPTPAIVLQEGDFLNFLREDFNWLVSDKNPTRRVIKN